MKKENIKNIIIGILIFIIIGLIIGLIVLYFKFELLEDKYDILEDRYEYSGLYEDNTQNKNKTKDEILNIVLNDLKISKTDIYDLDIELEYKARYAKNVYEVSFNYNHLEYEYYLDPVTGNILESFKSLS